VYVAARIHGNLTVIPQAYRQKKSMAEQSFAPKIGYILGYAH
jgi:hypothetical protein